MVVPARSPPGVVARAAGHFDAWQSVRVWRSPFAVTYAISESTAKRFATITPTRPTKGFLHVGGLLGIALATQVRAMKRGVS